MEEDFVAAKRMLKVSDIPGRTPDKLQNILHAFTGYRHPVGAFIQVVWQLLQASLEPGD
ncbi:hypothetical protein D3C81_1917000 [compost metagenome]